MVFFIANQARQPDRWTDRGLLLAHPTSARRRHKRAAANAQNGGNVRSAPAPTKPTRAPGQATPRSTQSEWRPYDAPTQVVQRPRGVHVEGWAGEWWPYEPPKID